MYGMRKQYGNVTINETSKKRKAFYWRTTFALTFSTAIAFTALSLSGCTTTTNQNNGLNSKLDLTKFATITTQAAVTNIESNYQASDVNELSIYAPNHYSTAGKAIEDAKTLLAQSQPRDIVVQKVAVADAILKNGDRVMLKVKDILKTEISIKEKLDSLNTKSIYSNEYGSLNERFNKLILEIESGNTKKITSREKLLKDMHMLERKAFQFSAMNEPREILKRVKYRGGEQLAPITFAEAAAVFKRAEEFIAANPNYDIGITQIGQEALFAAKRALYVTEGVSALKQRFEYAPEQIILDEEYRMYRVARQLADLDYRDNSLEVQSELLAKRAADVALELENKDGLVIALRDTLIKVRDSSSRLTMLSESATKLEQEKNQWLAKEALFKAKVTQLEENLSSSEAQLDFTQQKLLSFKTDNARLSEQASIDAQQTSALKNELAAISLRESKKEKSINEPKAGQAIVNLPAAQAPKTMEETTPLETVAAPKNVITDTPKENELVTPALTTNASQTETETKIAVLVPGIMPDKAPEIEGETRFEEAAANISDESEIPQKERAKITQQETLDAILSAKELIKSLNSNNVIPLAEENITEKESADFFNDDDNAFVDALE